MKPLNIRLIVYWVITVFFILPGLSNAEAADYFPLQVGNSWTYSPSYGDYGNRVDSVIGTETINGTLTYIWNRQEAPDDNCNEKKWLALAGKDIEMHKFWNNEGVAATFAPALTVGKVNPSVGDTYFFEADIEVNGTSVYFKTTHYIESITDTVTVRAGTFSNCIRIRELNESKINDVTEYEYKKQWYGPDVGPVIYRNYTENWASTVFSQELVSFSIVTSRKAMPWVPLLLFDGDKKLPVSGMWTGSAGFGGLSFIVNDASTGITEITLNYIEFSCGPVIKNGSLTITSELPINDGQFTMNRDSPNDEFTLSGMFDQTGMSASGAYRAVVYGVICQTNWDATPN